MTSVIDSSVILAFLNREPGWERAESEIDGGVVSSLVYAEVVTRLTLAGTSMQQIDDLWSELQILVEPFDSARARRAGLLVQATARRGLSLADRACLALALELGVAAVTADRAWTQVDLGVEVRLIR